MHPSPRSRGSSSRTNNSITIQKQANSNGIVKLSIINNEGKNIGHADIKHVVKPNSSTNYTNIAIVHIEESQRGKGFSRKIISEIEKDSKRNNCHGRLRLDASYAMGSPASLIYYKMGFKFINQNLQKDLEEKISQKARGKNIEYWDYPIGLMERTPRHI